MRVQHIKKTSGSPAQAKFHKGQYAGKLVTDVMKSPRGYQYVEWFVGTTNCKQQWESDVVSTWQACKDEPVEEVETSSPSSPSSSPPSSPSSAKFYRGKYAGRLVTDVMQSPRGFGYVQWFVGNTSRQHQWERDVVDAWLSLSAKDDVKPEPEEPQKLMVNDQLLEFPVNKVSWSVDSPVQCAMYWNGDDHVDLPLDNPVPSSWPRNVIAETTYYKTKSPMKLDMTSAKTIRHYLQVIYEFYNCRRVDPSELNGCISFFAFPGFSMPTPTYWKDTLGCHVFFEGIHNGEISLGS